MQSSTIYILLAAAAAGVYIYMKYGKSGSFPSASGSLTPATADLSGLKNPQIGVTTSNFAKPLIGHMTTVPAEDTELLESSNLFGNWKKKDMSFFDMQRAGAPSGGLSGPFPMTTSGFSRNFNNMSINGFDRQFVANMETQLYGAKFQSEGSIPQRVAPDYPNPFSKSIVTSYKKLNPDTRAIGAIIEESTMGNGIVSSKAINTNDHRVAYQLSMPASLW